MENKAVSSKPAGTQRAKLWILLGILAVIIIIIIVAANQQGKSLSQSSGQNPSGAGSTASGQKAATGTSTPTTGTSTPTNALKDTVVMAPGANPITKENVVVTTSGQATKNDVSAASPVAPQQTLAIAPSKLASSVIQITETKATGFTPNTFTVKAGAPVTVSLTNKETDRSATLAFTDPSMSGVVLGAGFSETRAITFNAPTKTGTYTFIDGIPGHNATGQMIVK